MRPVIPQTQPFVQQDCKAGEPLVEVELVTVPAFRVLDPQTLQRAAELRAEGSSWAAAGRVLGHDGDDLRRLCEEAGWKFDRLYVKACRKVLRDSLAESLFTLRKGLRDEDTKEARRAAETLARVGMTFYRHRSRGASKKAPKPDPRTRHLSEDDIAFVTWLSDTSDEQLAALSAHFRAQHPELFDGAPEPTAPGQ